MQVSAKQLVKPRPGFLFGHLEIPHASGTPHNMESIWQEAVWSAVLTLRISRHFQPRRSIPVLRSWRGKPYNPDKMSQWNTKDDCASSYPWYVWKGPLNRPLLLSAYPNTVPLVDHHTLNRHDFFTGCQDKIVYSDSIRCFCINLMNQLLIYRSIRKPGDNSHQRFCGSSTAKNCHHCQKIASLFLSST